MPDDRQLIRRFAADRSETAFGELVARHLSLVYSAALRQTSGDPHLAQDIAQLVFTDLARKAPAFSENVVLAGWLHRATIFSARQILRGERRRRAREQEVITINAIQSETENNDWKQIRPLLDEALNRLNKTDREALLLRFFEQQSLTQVGVNLGTNEDAARKRVNRALEKLRTILTRRGMTTTAAALSTVISANAVQIAPAGLAVTLTSTSLAVAGTGTTFTLLKIMTMTKLKLGISALVIATATTALVIQHQAQIKLREQNESLSQQIAQLQSDNEGLSKKVTQAERMAHLSTPPTQFVVPSVAASTEPISSDVQSTNLIAKFLKGGEVPTLTHEQVEAYLKANGRNAASLLAAFQGSGDLALFQEAMEKYPNDPQVDFRAALDKDLSPQQQRQWLNAFEQSAPDNALANYLSALNYFQSGQNDQAVQELNTAAGKSQFQDYFQDSQENLEEAYLAAGYSVADAEEVGPAQIQLPQLAALRQLGQNMVNLANSYQQAGDTTSAQATLQMAVNLGQNLNDPFLITSLVGVAIEKNAFSAMDPNAPYGSAGQTVQDQLNQLAQQKTVLMDVNDQFNNSVAPTMSEQDWVSYEQRRTIFGETAAQQWAIAKYTQQ
ncbi:MAG: sigma-70 family RNA polymerase sigma factor [Verrucomicrobiota bacterium]|jgi:RNA polymerase sigma factor (sigma-70 family)